MTSEDKTTGLADRSSEDISKWFEGRWLYEGRSCGDCSDGPPCRCSLDASELSPRQQAAVDFYRSAENAR